MSEWAGFTTLMIFCQAQAVLAMGMLICSLEHFRQGIITVVDMDYEYNDGTAWKADYGDMGLETAKVLLTVINGLSFIVQLTMQCMMMCLFYRGLKWGVA